LKKKPVITNKHLIIVNVKPPEFRAKFSNVDLILEKRAKVERKQLTKKLTTFMTDSGFSESDSVTPHVPILNKTNKKSSHIIMKSKNDSSDSLEFESSDSDSVGSFKRRITKSFLGQTYDKRKQETVEELKKKLKVLNEKQAKENVAVKAFDFVRRPMINEQTKVN
jgi:hypothetical protein